MRCASMHRSALALASVSLANFYIGGDNVRAADGFFGSFSNPAPGAARAWQQSYGVSPYSQFNLYNGNTLTTLVLASFDPIGPPVGVALHHNSSDATDDVSGEPGQGFDLGRGWSTSYSGRVTLNMAETVATVREDDGRRNRFTKVGDYWDPPTGVHDRLRLLGGGGWELRRPSQSVRVYDADGLLTEVQDSSGNKAIIVRDPNNASRITAVQSAAYGLPDPNSNLNVHEIAFKYDDPNHPARLTSIVDVIEREWRFTYDGNGRLNEIQYPSDSYVAESTLTLAYHAGSGRVTQIHARRAGADLDIYWTYAYSGELLEEVTDPLENTGDPNDIPVQGIGSSIDFRMNPGGGGGVTFYVREITDRRGHLWEWKYDQSGLLVSSTDPLSGVRSFEYDGDRNLTSSTDELGNEWSATYGSVGNVATLTGPLNGQTWTYTWDQAGDPNSNLMRLTKIEDPNSRWTEYAYADPNDPNHPDDSSKLVRITQEAATSGGASAVTKLRYYWDDLTSTHGQLKSVMDHYGVVTEFAFDHWGYPAGLTEGLTTNEPAELHPVTLSQRNGATGWIIGASDQPGWSGLCCVTDDIVYDANGNPVASCSCLCSNLSTDDYERLGDLPPEVFARGKQSVEPETSYDVVGNPINIDRTLPSLINGDPFDTLRNHNYARDDYRRLTSYETESSNGENALSRIFDFDAYDYDNRVLQTTGPDGVTTSYTYDELGRPESITRGNMSADFDYYADSSLKRVDYGNGAAADYAYDAARRLTTIEHRDALDDVVFQLDYDWALNGLVRSRTETTPGGIWLVEFEYDRRNRLTRETRTKTSADPDVVEYDIEYEYDQLGNRLERTDFEAELWTVYSYDVDSDPNQLEYPTRHNRLLWYETYDTSGAGNQLLRGVQYTYYDNGQVANITLKDENADPNDPNAGNWHYDLALHYFTHGPLRLAVWGRWQDSQAGPINYEVLRAREFRYDDVRARYLTVDYDTPSSSASSWTIVDDAVQWTDYEGAAPYADSEVDAGTVALAGRQSRLLALTAEQTFDPNDPNITLDTTYWHEDLIGSTMQTTDAAGDAAAAVSYTAFGEPVGDFSQMPRYQYAGGFGYESGLLTLEGPDPTLPPIMLQHVGWRWYQAEIGRFVQRDPAGYLGGLSAFRYGDNSPIVNIDTDGRIVVSIVIVGGTYGATKLFEAGWTFGWNSWAAGKIAENNRLYPSPTPNYRAAFLCVGLLSDAPGVFHNGPPGLPTDPVSAGGTIGTGLLGEAGIGSW